MFDFDRGLQYQQFPGLAEYPAFDIDIVSPELPCGCAWLVNCLIELGVPIWKPWNIRTHDNWKHIGTRRYRYVDAAEEFRNLLPSIKNGREFEFIRSPVPRVYHYWPGFYRSTRKTILFVRDPRDALHSAWRRAASSGICATDIGFETFVASRYFHYPLTWGEYLLLFLRLWREALDDRDHIVLRYEDYRDNPLATLRRAVDFIGVQASDDALAHALNASSFENANAIEPTETRHAATRAGIAHEFRATFSASMHAAIDRRFDPLLAWLEYDPNEVDVDAKRATSTPESIALLERAMLFEQALPQESAWLGAQVRRHAADLTLVGDS